MSDSTTGGPILPDPGGPAPLEGQALNHFLQGWFVGVSGVAPQFVRPRWQPEPDNIPDAGNYWAAFGVTRRPNDDYVSIVHMPQADNGEGADIMIRNETLAILVSFYDLGVNGQADFFASQFKDGLQIPQNRELLDRNGYAFVEASEPVVVPTLFKERWLYRVDVAVTMRRQIQRQYAIRNLVIATGTIVTDTGYDAPFVTSAPTNSPKQP